MSNNEIAKPTQNATSTQFVTSRTVKYLFAKMHAIYGSKWASQYPNQLLPAVQHEWLNMLQDVTADELRHGLDTWREDWPPNACEFYHACKSAKAQTTPACHKLLEPPRVTKAAPEIARDHLSQCRAYLGKRHD